MQEESSNKETKKKSIVATLTGVGLFSAVALKFQGFFLTALKALSFLKFGWLASSFSSMFLSLGLYALVYGWRFAITIIVLIYIHEMGHYWYMKYKGLSPKAPVFVPFLGAYVAMTALPNDKATNAWVAYAGPLVGGVAAGVSFYLGLITGNIFLVAAANTGFILNLLQLVPVKPFDGGFIAQSISKWLFIPGAIALFLLAIVFKSGLLFIIALVSLFVTVQAFKKSPVDLAMVEATSFQKLVITASYLGLAFALAYSYWASSELLKQIHS